MKLYLSSYRLGNHAQDLVRMAGSGHFALVPNALDGEAHTEHRQAFMRRGRRDLEELGLTTEIVDLQDFFERPERLPEQLSRFENVFILGGNVFVLRRAMALSGFDTFVTARANRPDFLYAGYSAGSCVCSPHLEALRWVDDPEVISPNGGEPIDSGLSLIPFLFIPHFRSAHHESEKIEHAVQHCIDLKVLFRAYRDGEVLIQDPLDTF